jgi:glutathione S-transferase
MKLIGMLDSPYVRRVAISMQLLGLRFEHQPLSVFSGFEQFRKINPAVKAPTLVCDDGTVLSDSSMILEAIEAFAAPRTLNPKDPVTLAHDLAVVGMSLAACEKTVQLVYERNLRPPKKLHEPWVERITRQLHGAYTWIDQRLEERPLPMGHGGIRQAAVTAGVAWHFTRCMLPNEVLASDYPHLEALSAQAEQLAEFQAAPHGPEAVSSNAAR